MKRGFVGGVAFPPGRYLPLPNVSNPIQPLIENLSAYPAWLFLTCILVVLVGVLAFFSRVFRFVLVIALAIAGLVLVAFMAIQFAD